jgi:hypothetical protein
MMRPSILLRCGIAILLVFHACQADIIATLLEPAITVGHFQKQVYNQRAHIVNRSPEQATTFLELLTTIEPLTMAVESAAAFAEHGYMAYADGVTPHTADGDVLRMNTTINVSSDVRELYQQGVSFVVKAELVNITMSPLQEALQQHFTTDITVHAYVSPGGAQALKVSRRKMSNPKPSDLLPLAAHGPL